MRIRYFKAGSIIKLVNSSVVKCASGIYQENDHCSLHHDPTQQCLKHRFYRILTLVEPCFNYCSILGKLICQLNDIEVRFIGKFRFFSTNFCNGFTLYLRTTRSISGLEKQRIHKNNEHKKNSNKRSFSESNFVFLIL